jgi:hypothetical protein
MKIEIVAAGIVADEIGRCGDEGGEADDGWAEEAAKSVEARPMSQMRDMGHPAFGVQSG